MVQILNLITTAIFLAATTHLTKEELTPWLAQLGWLWDVLGDIIIAYLVIIILMRLVLLLARIKRLITIHGSTKILHAFTTEFFLTAINSSQHTCCPCSDLDLEALRLLSSETKTAREDAGHTQWWILLMISSITQQTRLQPLAKTNLYYTLCNFPLTHKVNITISRPCDCHQSLANIKYGSRGKRG